MKGGLFKVLSKDFPASGRLLQKSFEYMEHLHSLQRDLSHNPNLKTNALIKDPPLESSAWEARLDHQKGIRMPQGSGGSLIGLGDSRRYDRQTERASLTISALLPLLLRCQLPLYPVTTQCNSASLWYVLYGLGLFTSRNKSVPCVP